MIVNTSTAVFGNTDKPTGLWLSELVHFYDYFDQHNYQIDIYNVEGGHTPIDPVSLKRFTLDNVTQQYYRDEHFMHHLNHAPSIDTASPEQYDAIYFTGGHGVMYDFPENKSIQQAVNTIYQHGGVVSAVCHGIAALLNVKNDKGRYFIDHKNITGFSNVEEVLANRQKIVPFSLENELKRREANYHKALVPFTTNVVVDERLVTGQNPQSPKQVAQSVQQLLEQS